MEETLEGTLKINFKKISKKIFSKKPFVSNPNHFEPAQLIVKRFQCW